ncbi:MAG: hypothetical protein PHP79_03810 [Clostridia bacterium]|nr:hypothetical protein [Clostridia bacterium]
MKSKIKKILVLSLIIGLVFSLAACGAKEKIEEKVGEKITETIIEKAVGDENTQVDIDGDTIKIKDTDGGEVSLGGTEWSEIDYLPEFKGGNMISAANDSEGKVMIILEKVEENDYKNYVEDINKDFTENVKQIDTDEYSLFEGKNGKGYRVAVQYFHGDKSLTIIGNNESQQD